MTAQLPPNSAVPEKPDSGTLSTLSFNIFLPPRASKPLSFFPFLSLLSYRETPKISRAACHKTPWFFSHSFFLQMISIDFFFFSQPIISGSALKAWECWFGTFHPISMATGVRNAGSGPHSEQQDQTHGMKHSRTNSGFGMFQWQTSFVLTLNSNSICGNIPKSKFIRVWEFLGCQESSPLKEETPATDFHLTLGRFDFTEVPVGTGLKENNKSCKIHSILRSSDPAWTKHPFCFRNPTSPSCAFCCSLD